MRIPKVNITQCLPPGPSRPTDHISLQCQKLDWQLHSKNAHVGGQENKSRDVCRMELTARGSLLLTSCSSGLAFNYSSFFCSKVASVQLYSPQSYLQRKGTQPHSDHPSLTLHPSVYSSMGCVEKARPQLSSTWWPESNITSPRPKSQFPITESPADTEYTPSDQKSTCHLSSCMGAQIPCTTYTVSLLGIQFLLPYSFLGYLEAEYVFLGWRQSTFYFQ